MRRRYDAKRRPVTLSRTLHWFPEQKTRLSFTADADAAAAAAAGAGDEFPTTL